MLKSVQDLSGIAANFSQGCKQLYSSTWTRIFHSGCQTYGSSLIYSGYYSILFSFLFTRPPTQLPTLPLLTLLCCFLPTHTPQMPTPWGKCPMFCRQGFRGEAKPHISLQSMLFSGHSTMALGAVLGLSLCPAHSLQC